MREPGDPSWEHTFIGTNGVQLHVVQAGPPEGPLLFLLHGFPEFWYSWRHQIPALAAAGYRVWVPDQRGYYKSDKPSSTKAYELSELSADILGLLEASGRDSCSVIGHDWGGVVAWSLAATAPEKLRKVAIMDVPPLPVMIRNLWANPGQLAKSWYIVLLQIPGVAERLFSAKDWLLFRKALEEGGVCSPEELPHYKRAWSTPGACRAMFQWYRAGLPRFLQPPPMPWIEPPALVLWGSEDRYLSPSMGHESLRYCRQGELQILDGLGHFIHQQAPETINRLLLEFLKRAP